MYKIIWLKNIIYYIMWNMYQRNEFVNNVIKTLPRVL